MKDKEKQIEICENCKKQNNCNHRVLIHKDGCRVNDCDYYSETITTDKEKQIEEMAKELIIAFGWKFGRPNEFNYIAEYLVEQGYQKLLKDSVVLSMEMLSKRWIDLLTEFDEMGFEPTTLPPNDMSVEEYTAFYKDKLLMCLANARKETAEKIMLDLKGLLEGFIHKETGENLYVYKCKQFGVEIKE